MHKPLLADEIISRTLSELALSELEVSRIVSELGKRGLRDPRPLAARKRPPLSEYVKAEVKKSLARVRLDPPDGPPTAAVFHELGKLLLREPKLRRHLGISELQAKIYSALEQEPPEGSDAFKHRCADEAFYLLETFTEKKPGWKAVETIASLLHSGGHANLERASRRVHANRNKYPRNNA